MKKLLAVCTLVGASVPAYAVEIGNTGVDFYGSLRIMLEHKKDAEDDVAFKDASSRIGLKGSYDLGDGLSAFAKYEVAVDLDNDGETIGDMRYGHIGLANEQYGSLALGKVDSPFYRAVGVAGDYLWWNTAPVYYTLDGALRLSESAYYKSPDLGGLQVQALYQVDDESDNEQAQLAATYDFGDLTLGAAMSAPEEGQDMFGAAAYYSGNGFYVNANYMDKEDKGYGMDAILGIPSGKNLYTIGLSDFSAESSDKDFTAAILAYQRKLHKNVLVWAEFMAWDGSLYGVEDSNQLNVGINFNF